MKADPLSVACPVCFRPRDAVCCDPRGNARWGRPHRTRVRAAERLAIVREFVRDLHSLPMKRADWQAQWERSAREQHAIFFIQMARNPSIPWHCRRGSCGPVLLRADAPMDVELPILVRNVHAMTADTLVNKLHAMLSA